MKKIKNINELKNMLSDNLTLFFIKDMLSDKENEIIEDINDLYEEVELIILDLDLTSIDKETQLFFEKHFVKSLPFLIVYENKIVKRVMNGFNNIDWLEFFMLGEKID